MAQHQAHQSDSHCMNCGFEAAGGGENWDTVESPSLGRLTRCPECGSTDITLRR